MAENKLEVNESRDIVPLGLCTSVFVQLRRKWKLY